ncbi:MAG: tRNA (adenosine(37)-N6)-threonylcarbamoyltransferase complex dimerization subunit type 1 TsaB [Bacteroidia bacterium]|nr:tRNA (adenosine(37)-N6)-threonylcarbamoyltransferase complex dimerization subunit type 1 TsaB [Bacteroidia bacterium]
MESTEDKSHATRLTLLIQELLRENYLTPDNLDAISLSMGPGSYTGLRIGASVAKGLAYGSGVPLIGIPTLKALAHGFSLSQPSKIPVSGSNNPVLLCPMLDARRMEVYAALYDTCLNEINPVEAIILEARSFSQVLNKQMICFFGSGSNKAAEIIEHPNACFFPHVELSASYQSEPAESLYNRGEFLDTAYFEPHYLKEFIASIPKNKVLG